MFGIDDFALWFGWYFVSDLAQHPATQRLMEKAEITISDPNRGITAEDPDALLDWLEQPVKGPLAVQAPGAAGTAPIPSELLLLPKKPR